MAAQYFLTYNSVTIPITRIQFSQQIEYSDDGVDRLYSHVTLNVQGVINRGVTNTDNASYIRTLRTTFAEPRKYLQYYMIDDIAGVSFIINVPAGGDAKNGPNVKDVSITDVQGGSILVTATIETWLAECDATGSQPGAILSCRWQQEVEIDQNDLSTITTDGLLVVRSDANVTADQLRNQIIPVKTIPAGFVRNSRHFTQSSDGTKLMFTVVDVEKLRPPTDGITDWEATWKESSSLDNGGGVIVIGTLGAKAAAPKNISKSKILQFLSKVAFSRISFTPDSSGKKDLLLSYDITESLHTNEVYLDMQVRITSQANSANMPTSSRIGVIVDPLDSSSNKTQWNERGTALAQLFAAVIAPTCATKGSATASNQVSGTAATKYNSEIAVAREIVVTTTNKVTEDQKENPYTIYEINEKIINNYNNIQLPIGSPSNANTAMNCILAPMTAKKIIRFHLERLGAFPVIPSPFLDANHFVLSAEITTTESRFLPDGVNVAYLLAGEYEIGMFTPLVIGLDQVKLPRSPIQATGTSITTISSSNYDPTITS